MVVLGDTGFPLSDGLAGGSKADIEGSVMEEILCLALGMELYGGW
jgi:hypothetical protein